VIEALGAAAGCFGGWVVAAFAIGAVYATFTVGTSGGPNKGEHPMTVTAIHAVAFFAMAKGWPRGAWWGYLGLLAVTFAYALAAIGFVGKGARTIWIGRGVMAALHAAMFAVAWRAA
jgi:hypothetical protein